MIAIAIAAPVYAYFLARVGWHTLIEDCHLLYTKIPASLVFYNSARTGLDQPWSSLLQMLGGAAVAIGIASLIVLGVFLDKPNYWPILDLVLFVFLSLNGWFWFKSKP